MLLRREQGVQGTMVVGWAEGEARERGKWARWVLGTSGQLELLFFRSFPFPSVIFGSKLVLSLW
jgi:hypothetical protein